MRARMGKRPMAAALDDLRVLDLSGPIGHYAGRLLADLGADVIKVEPPGGDAARTYAPYLPDVDAPENGLQFLLLNAKSAESEEEARGGGVVTLSHGSFTWAALPLRSRR